MTTYDASTGTSSQDSDAASALAEKCAQQLLSLDVLTRADLPYGNWPQSLAHGAAGIALLHIERAARGAGSWQVAHRWIGAAAESQVSCGANAGAYYGAPALAFVLRVAAEAGPGGYRRALENLDQVTDEVVRRRINAVRRRAAQGEMPPLAEFDTLRGLTGLGMLLKYRGPDSTLLRDVLSCLVDLARPIRDGDDLLPGWWTSTGPNGKLSPEYPGGHANTGLAHGIAGPISLLSHALRHGIAVDGQPEAIAIMCSWLDRWQQDGETGPWWPHWITRTDLVDRATSQSTVYRPSWCYGTAGIARAQQLAALALKDPARQLRAEQALVAALADPAQLAATTDVSLCHGFAGLLHIATRAAADAVTPQIRTLIPRLLVNLVASAGGATPRDPGFLDGAAGTALALYAFDSPPATAWDQVLAIG